MLISVKVSPKSKLDEVTKLTDTSFRVKTTALPEGGKANQAVIELLAKYFSVAKSKVHLHAGFKSKEKIFLIESQDLDLLKKS